jgi:hypothetical protein
VAFLEIIFAIPSDKHYLADFTTSDAEYLRLILTACIFLILFPAQRLPD